MKPIIGMTMGDPGGIGPEIILKTVQKHSFKKSSLLLIGSEEVFRLNSRRLKIPFRPHCISSLKDHSLKSNRLNFLDISKEAEALFRKKVSKSKKIPKKISIGKISEWNATLALASLEVAIQCAKQGLIHGMATAPLNKSEMRMILPRFDGHTGYLAKKSGSKKYAMMFVSPRLRVTLVTIHLPLKKVPSKIKKEGVFSKISLTNDFLKKHLSIRHPKIGVAALNPHGREFGSEEDRLIAPAVRKARKKKIHVVGPLPGDQIFYDAYHRRLDAVIAMYHDQALAPFKMIAFDQGVNVTLGLPYVRTSPDHGTAYDIAYRNKANPAAFQYAFRFLEQTVLSSRR